MINKVSAIICVYNEEKTLKDVITSVSEYSIVNEIIVVNDSSTDATEKIIKELKQDMALTDIHLKENKGKGYAMAVGVENAKNEIIVFIDADQTKIVSGYINHMVKPLLKKECDMVLGYSTVNILSQDINPLKILTGERAIYRKDITPILDKMKESRFGVETLLYFYFISMGKTLKFIRLVGLAHKDKYKKVPFAKATTNYINEGWEIAYTAVKNYDLVLKTFKNAIKKNIKI
ncbi:MAG TPA: glycosyltransferase family 2 protein [Candidatus Paceibacterota bacterium]|nr:glycosyltransferase family 2 protein [Candidatus Paceibacterota bacterium]HPS18431.1 glycosyltransferase family 2 protein [Bacteroidales bacterium]